MGAEEAPHNDAEREEIVEIHPPIPGEDENGEERVRWEQIDPEELVYPYPPAVNLRDLVADDEHQMRHDDDGRINQYMHLRDQPPLIVEDGRVIQNRAFNADDFRGRN